MNFPRSIEPEILDHLPENDPRAVRSRADLRRINRIMAARSITMRALHELEPPKSVLELGAGDGTLMLGIARQLADRWPSVHLTLLDRQRIIARDTIDAFNALGWRVDILNADVLDWAANDTPDRYELATANLFLHHFDDKQLTLLLSAIANRADVFFCCEPRRARLPLIGSYLVGLIGANAVTREDAVLSVRAGFSGAELTALWPHEGAQWQTREYAAGLFSHCFFAKRRGR